MSKTFLSLILFLITSLSSFALEELSVTGTHIYFLNNDNQREKILNINFPERNRNFKKINLKLTLRCPRQACDWWDRRGSIKIQKDGHNFEILRFMTPYRIGNSWDFDITYLRPLLISKTKLKIFIDTWVGPGHPQGEGWIVDLKFQFTKGNLDKKPFKVLSILEPQTIPYGNPKLSSKREKIIEKIGPIKKALLWSVITGHGQGNTENCAEFCSKSHTIKINHHKLTKTIWRDDCYKNPTPGQYGTWRYSRAGWCPGDIVYPWVEDITSIVKDKNKVQFFYSPEFYINRDRNDNGRSHTSPYFYNSSFIILFK